MAKKIEKWLDNKGHEWSIEHYALTEDLENALRESGQDITPPVVSAIDALHEYAHRGDKAADTQRDSGTALPEGVPPELNDWVKRWEWVTARVTILDVRNLQHDDDVRIGSRWFHVVYSGPSIINIAIGDSDNVGFHADELAAIANEVRYNGR
jgi:hypothetical protein